MGQMSCTVALCVRSIMSLAPKYEPFLADVLVRITGSDRRSHRARDVWPDGRRTHGLQQECIFIGR